MLKRSDAHCAWWHQSSKTKYQAPKSSVSRRKLYFDTKLAPAQWSIWCRNIKHENPHQTAVTRVYCDFCSNSSRFGLPFWSDRSLCHGDGCVCTYPCSSMRSYVAPGEGDVFSGERTTVSPFAALHSILGGYSTCQQWQELLIEPVRILYALAASDCRFLPMFI